MSHKQLISTTGASSEISINVLVTVQEGGQWMDAEFQGTPNELLRQLFDPNHWLVLKNEESGSKTRLTIVEGLRVGEGMSGTTTVHSVKLQLSPGETITYDSHFRGLTDFDNPKEYQR